MTLAFFVNVKYRFEEIKDYLDVVEKQLPVIPQTSRIKMDLKAPFTKAFFVITTSNQS